MANWRLANILPTLGAGNYTVTAEMQETGGVEVSAPVTFVVDLTGPSQVTGLTVNSSGGAPLLQWSPLTDSDLVGYEIWRRVSTAPASSSAFLGFQAGTPLIGGSGGSGVTYLDTSAAAGTTYLYKIAGRDSAGNISALFSAEVSSGAVGPVTVTPPAWGSGYPQALNDGVFVFQWSHVNPTGENLDRYFIEYRVGTSSTWTEIINQFPSTNAFYSGFTPGQSYTFRIRARNTSNNFSAYSTSGAIVALGSGGTDTTPPTPPPTSPGVEAIPGGTCIVTWVASISSDVAEYGVWRRREDEASFTEIATVPVADPRSYIDTGLTAGFNYSYRINATDTSDNVSSTFSGITTVMALPAGPTGLARVTVNPTGDGFLAGGRTFLPAGFHIGNLASDWDWNDWPRITEAFTEIAGMGANVVRVGTGGFPTMVNGINTSNLTPNQAGQSKLSDVFDLMESLGLYAVIGYGGGLGVGSAGEILLNGTASSGATSFSAYPATSNAFGGWSIDTNATLQSAGGANPPTHKVDVGDYLYFLNSANGHVDVVQVASITGGTTVGAAGTINLVSSPPLAGSTSSLTANWPSLSHIEIVMFLVDEEGEPEDYLWVKMSEQKRWEAQSKANSFGAQVTQGRSCVMAINHGGEKMASDGASLNNRHVIANTNVAARGGPGNVATQWCNSTIPEAHSVDNQVLSLVGLLDFSNTGASGTNFPGEFEHGVCSSPHVDIVDPHLYIRSSDTITTVLDRMKVYGQYNKPVMYTERGATDGGLRRQNSQQIVRGQFLREQHGYGHFHHYGGNTPDELKFTSLTVAASSGATTVTVNSVANFANGDVILIGWNDDPGDLRTITSINVGAKQITFGPAQGSPAGLSASAPIGADVGEIAQFLTSASLADQIRLEKIFTPTQATDVDVAYIVPELVESGEWTPSGSVTDHIDAMVGYGEVSPDPLIDTEGLTTTSVGAIERFRMQRIPLNGKTTKSIDVSFYLQTAPPSGRTLVVKLITGATQLGTQSFSSSASVGWKNFTITNSLNQSQVDNLKIAFEYQ